MNAKEAVTVYRIVKEVVDLQDQVRTMRAGIEALVGQNTRIEARFKEAQGEQAGMRAALQSLARTNERLLAERRTFLEALAWQALKERGIPTREERPEPPTVHPLFDLADLERATRGMRKPRATGARRGP